MPRKFVFIKTAFLYFFISLYLTILLQIEHLYFIKSALKIVYSRKQSQCLYLIPQVPHFLPFNFI